jgi:hypothetical protein
LHLAAAYRVLAEIETVAPHLEWMRDTAPTAIIEGDEVVLPFGPIL